MSKSDPLHRPRPDGDFRCFALFDRKSDYMKLRHPRVGLIALSLSLSLFVLTSCSVLGPANVVSDSKSSCEQLTGSIPNGLIGLPTGEVTIVSTQYLAASPLVMGPPQAPTPYARIQPALPDHCQVKGTIASLDPKAPAINFQVNLPSVWNGRSLQYGGGGFNGVLINALGLPPAAPLDKPAPLARGFVTYGTDSGHQNTPGVPLQAFSMNDEALANFAYASYKKVRDVSVELMKRRYGRGPDRMYFMGSSEGGREALMLAQRFPNDFDGIFARVPVINWVALQHAGTRAGIAQFGSGWITPAKIKLVGDAVASACDAADGIVDGIISDHEGCRSRFDVSKLRCADGSDSGASCLSDAQTKAVQALYSGYRFDFDLANGVRNYPGWPMGGEATPGVGPTGGWANWWVGSSAPVQPPVPANSIQWFYGSGAIRYFITRDPNFDVRQYDPKRYADRIRTMSALMDATDPDLSVFAAAGGKLIIKEHMADYAQSPYAGIEYYKSVVAKMGQSEVDRFARLYIAPGVDHVGTGAPALTDMLEVLTDWVEKAKEPAALTVATQAFEPPFAVTMSRPLCRYPNWPKYRGVGDSNQAASFDCVKQ